MTRRVVAIIGLSGVGKSTLIKSLNQSIQFRHLQASALIKQERCASNGFIAHDKLRFADLDENQQLLVRAFERETNGATGLIVLDGHTVIELDGDLTRIESQVFKAMGISRMIFLADDPKVIAERRLSDQSRVRPVVSNDQLKAFQQQAHKHAIDICAALKIPFHSFRADQHELIAAAINGTAR